MLSEHTRRLVERHCRRYCALVCPPEIANQVRLGFRIAGDDVWLFELRPLFRTLGMHAAREVPLARLRFNDRSHEWSLHRCDTAGHPRRYAPRPRARDFLALLREFDRDPHGLFWDRVNGASLRWCSARGRCQHCELCYTRVLGATDLGTLDLQRCGS
jgi:hypothetical protein